MCFKNYECLFAALGGIIASFLFWVATPMTMLPFWIPVIIAIILITLVWYIVILKISHREELETLNTSKITIIEFIPNDNEILFSTKQLNTFQYDTYITVWIIENDKREKLYGIAKVINIQNKNIVNARILQTVNLRQINSEPHINNLLLKHSIRECDWQSVFNYQINFDK